MLKRKNWSIGGKQNNNCAVTRSLLWSSSRPDFSPDEENKTTKNKKFSVLFLFSLMCFLFISAALYFPLLHIILPSKDVCVALRNRHGLLQMPRMESAGYVRGWDAFRRRDMTRSIKKDELRFSLFCPFSVLVLFRVWSLRLFAVIIAPLMTTALFRGKQISLATTPHDIPNCKDSPYLKLYSIIMPFYMIWLPGMTNIYCL